MIVKYTLDEAIKAYMNHYSITVTCTEANLKEKLIWYIISIVLIYGAVGIATIVYNIVQAIIST